MSSHDITPEASVLPENVQVYMFCLSEMKAGVNQRTFFGNEAQVRFKVMKRDEEKTLRFPGGWMKGVCSFIRIDRLHGVKFKGE